MPQEKVEVLKTVETPETESSSPQSSEGTGLEFEEPDFGAITDFVESDGEEVPVVADAEIAEESAEVQASPEEAAAEVKEGESAGIEEGEGEKPEKLVEAEEKESAEKEPEVAVAEAKAEAETPPEVATAPEPEPVKVPTREELEGMYAEHREKTLPQLEKIFTLSEEDAAALDEQPSKVIPKLAGQMMYDTMLSTYNAVIAALPSVVGTYMAATNQADEAQTKFFDAWPALNKPESVSAASAAIQAYRSANPRAELEEVIKNAGVMAMINLGLDPTQKAEVSPKPAARPRPPKPVAPHGAIPTPPVRASDQIANEFDELTKLFQEENA